MSNSKFYSYRQNNSGGHFEINRDEGVGHIILVEAFDEDSADVKAEKIGIYFDGVDNAFDCECCGDRWYRAWEGDASNVVMPDKYKSRFQTEDEYLFVHYLDGSVKEILIPKAIITTKEGV